MARRSRPSLTPGSARSTRPPSSAPSAPMSALAEDGVEASLTAVGLDQAADDRQSQTAAAQRRDLAPGAAVERLEDTSLILRRDARALVAHLDPNPLGAIVGLLASGADRDRA